MKQTIKRTHGMPMEAKWLTRDKGSHNICAWNRRPKKLNGVYEEDYSRPAPSGHCDFIATLFWPTHDKYQEFPYIEEGACLKVVG